MDITLIRRWATPLTIGAFILMAVTGILMFFHVQIGIIKDTHEWLSWAMVIAVGLHVTLHWKSFNRYFANKATLGVIGVFVALLVGSMLIPGEGGPKRGGGLGGPAMGLLMEAPLNKIGVLTDKSPELLQAKLQQQGLTVDSVQTSIQDIAKQNHRNPMEVLNGLLK